MNRLLLIIFTVLLISIVSCSTKGFKRGKILYDAYCSDCHMNDGSGLEGLFPPIDNSDYLKTHKLDLACIIHYGLEGKIKVNGKEYSQKMNGFPKITESDIANIVNYINYKFLGDEEYVNIKEIKEMLSNCDEVIE